MSSPFLWQFLASYKNIEGCNKIQNDFLLLVDELTFYIAFTSIPLIKKVAVNMNAIEFPTCYLKIVN